jgi:hypothetical protein
MRRRWRSVLIASFLLGGTAALVVGVLGVLVKTEPAFYATEMAVAPDATDPQVAADLVTRFSDLTNDIRSRADWSASFTDDEINAAIREQKGPDSWLSRALPESVHDPRVSAEGDRFKFGLRYGTGFWSTVLSIELKAWLVKDELNMIALEIVGTDAGSLPVPNQWLLDRITEVARDANVTVEWYRHDGHPVGLFRLYADQARPPAQVRRFKLDDGRITIAGRSLLTTATPVAE